MTTYYKGYIFANKINPIKKIIGYYQGGPYHKLPINVVNTDPDFDNQSFIKRHGDDLIQNLLNEHIDIYKNYNIKIDQKEIIEILNRTLFNDITFSEQSELSIIYERLEDEHGNFYGKEILTGKVFPIYQNQHSNRGYFVKLADYLPNRKHIIITIVNNFSISTMDKYAYGIANEEVASHNEVNKYRQKLDIGENKKLKNKTQKRNQIFIEAIEILFNENVYNEEIKPKEKTKIVKQKQNIGTCLMENIEYLLTKLSKINKELYDEYSKKYETIILSENLSVASLAILEGEIEFYLTFNKKGINNILDYLDELKKEYLLNNLNKANMTTSITLKDIDKMEDLFLKAKDEYTLLSQRKIIKNLAFIYLMEVYENIDSISIDELKESYFQTNLKSILIIIESLRTLGIIKNDLTIDLNNDITVENILNIIKKIEFNNVEQESVNKLIRTI